MKRIIYLAMLLLIIGSCKKDHDAISGRVYYMDIHGVRQVAGGATVIASSNRAHATPQKSTVADADGHFLISDLKDGIYAANASGLEPGTPFYGQWAEEAGIDINKNINRAVDLVLHN